jgi:hypothetical protein
MSDLKHQDVPELRRRLRQTVSYRADLKRKWETIEEEIARLQASAAEHRRKWHNAGQREVWIRMYLAEKELNL